MKLDEVEVKTGTEEETVLYTQRCKLFVFGETLLDEGTGNKSWKERGVGDVTLLKHNEFGKIRLLMRQEKTLKIIVNHVVDPRIVLEPNSGSDRSWVWSAFDFSGGEELVETIFAMRFGNTEKAEAFKKEVSWELGVGTDEWGVGTDEWRVGSVCVCGFAADAAAVLRHIFSGGGQQQHPLHLLRLLH